MAVVNTTSIKEGATETQVMDTLGTMSAFQVTSGMTVQSHGSANGGDGWNFRDEEE